MYVPTPEEIKRETAKLRKEWTEHEYAQRSGKGETELKVVSTKFLEVTEDLKREMYREEVGPKPSRKKKPVVSTTDEEQLEHDQFQASAVSFGKTISQE